MYPQTGAPATESARKAKSRTARILRVCLRKLYKRRKLALALGLPVLVIGAITGALYYYYSNQIHQQLQDGAFPESADIYAAPFVLSDGDIMPLAGFEDRPAPVRVS